MSRSVGAFRTFASKRVGGREALEVGRDRRVELRLAAGAVVDERLVGDDEGAVGCAHDVGRGFAVGRRVVREQGRR